MLPSSLNGPRSTTILSWFQLSRHDSTLSTVFLFAAVAHQRLNYLTKRKTADILTPQNNEMLIFLELESIKRINEAMQNPSRALSDAVINSVGCLVNNSWDKTMWDENLRSPFQSPLRRLQLLDTLGSLSPNPVHYSGLAQMIKLREGLEQTELPGLAPILS
jgi:hypothetical protein